MKRRHFITLGAAAGIGAPFFRSSASSAAQGPEWKPDGLGSVARIGVLTPDSDPVPESEMSVMAPPGVSIHGSRVARPSGLARAFAEPPYVDTAVELLADLAPRVILFAFTSSSYALGAEADKAVRARLESRSGNIPVLFTCPAATEALRILGARRIALIHPPWFTEDMNAEGVKYFTTQGFDVARSTRISPSRSFTEVPPAEVYEWTKRNVPRQADAVFVGGNGLRAIGAIHALEDDLGKPVLTANQVLFWRALRLVGVASKVTQYGRVFTQPQPAG
jgi:maleate isomerase